MEVMMERPRRDRQGSLASSRTSSLDGDEDFRMPQNIHINTRKEDREREKALQKKLGELTTQIQRLERRISLLRTENETLRKKQDDSRPLEDKIKSLKKRNAELASIARRLEEKAKSLQQENSRVRSSKRSSSTTTLPGVDEISTASSTSAVTSTTATTTAPPSSATTTGSATPTPESSEHLRRVVARQRARDLAEHAKAMLAKDKEIEELRRKCQDLADQLSNGDVMAPVNVTQFEEKEELVNIIKQAAKERLQLEQQLGQTGGKVPSREEAQATKEREEKEAANEKHRAELEAANQILHQEIGKLEAALHKAESIEQQLNEKHKECEELNSKLSSALQQKTSLEKQVATAHAQEVKLKAEVNQLHEKVKEIPKVTEECNALKLSLASAQKERESAQQEVAKLNVRVHSLENLVRDLQESAERTNSLDDERKTILSQLQERQAQIEQLQQTKTDVESGHAHTVSTLTLQVKELEERRKQEEERRKEEEERREALAQEVERLRKEAEERQKVVEEAEKLREILVAKTLEIETTTALSKTQSHLKGGAEITGEDLASDDGRKLDVRDGMDRKLLNQNERIAGTSAGAGGESLLTSWAQKGPIQVYIAKYNYDPFTLSPNENPEMELPLTAGDYVLVVGDMDEDGFFEGELIDGRQGLVPCNFIEMVEEEDLVEFHSALMQAGHGDYSNTSLNNVSVNSNNNSFTTTNNNNNDASYRAAHHNAGKSDINNGIVMNDQEESSSDLEDIAEIDEETASVNSRVLANGTPTTNFAPCPKGLSLDRTLTSSVLVSWSPPEPHPGLEVQAYHVIVDGQLNTSVKATERTKALLEGVNLDKDHRICLRCLSNRGQSKDAQCTMLIGKDVYPKPSDLKVGHVTPTSALLSWLPGNSNYQHSISVNGKEVRVAKPGVFRHTLSGLAPGTLHKVTLIAKSISGVLNEEKSRRWVENVSASIEFTTPVAGAPDPPLNVQVESGPRKGTLLISWLPVTLSESGVSNGAVVSGYHILADDTKVKVITGATVDHAVLSAIDLKGAAPSCLWVRTVSESGLESGDSEQVLLPRSLCKELIGGQVSSEGHKGHDTDEEIEEAFREAQTTSGTNATTTADRHYSDSSSSELSDIPEVEEDLIGSQDSHLNEMGRRPSNQSPELSQVVASVSPQPAPRKTLSRGKGDDSQTLADSGPREFHAQKPLTSEGGNLLATPTRVVPAIEITRDSSLERAASQDESNEEGRASSSSPSTRHTPSKSRPPPGDPTSQNAPSAFRHVGDPLTSGHHPSQIGKLAGISSSSPHSYPQHENHSRHDSPSGGYASPSRRNNSKVPSSAGSPAHQPHSKQQSPQHSGKHTHHDSDDPHNLALDVADSDSISGEMNHPDDIDTAIQVDANTVRLFIALFDYDPSVMSPNVDSIDEELPFREGQILRVVGDKDSDGFYKGELAGRAGLVPCNMVSEVRIDDPELVEQLLQEAQGVGGTQVHAVNSSTTPNDAHLTPNGVPAVPKSGPMRRMVAMYDYDPQELSPNVDAELELSFKTGDTVLIYGDMDEDGFYTGEVRGQRGLVPSNFLQPAPLSDGEDAREEEVRGDTAASVVQSRSGESLEQALDALVNTDASSTNSPSKTVSETAPLGQQATPTPHGSAPSPSTNPAGSRTGTSSPASADKGDLDGKGSLKKKSGAFRNMLKRFTR